MARKSIYRHFVDISTQLDSLDEILVKNDFKHASTEDNKVTFEGDEFQIRNRVTKKDKEA